MIPDLQAALAAHRPALLRHCYRMLGSFADADDVVQETLERAWNARAEYRGTAPIQRWLYAIATNTCLNALARRRRRALPQLESSPAADDSALGETEADRWLTPAADHQLFPDPAELAESRETVTLAFVALLQRLSPRQRAVLLLKDVLGWPADEIATALGLSVSAVNSALHRGRETITFEKQPADEPSPEILSAFVRAWETRDLDALVQLLRSDVTLAMPPYAAWFQGAETVLRFFGSARLGAFWARLARVEVTRANGLPALAFFRSLEGVALPHSIMVTRFQGSHVAEMTVFIGPTHFEGFDLF